MMKKRLVLFVVLLVATLSIQAQKLVVDGMRVDPLDLSASQYERKDLARKPCALVKVQLAAVGAQFEGNVIGQVEYKTGEYWIYMSQDSYLLRVKHPSFVPLDVNFRDYGILGVAGKNTYVLTLLMPQSGPVNVDDGMRYLTLIVSPVNSKVTVDGQMREVDSDGSVSVYLQQGTHRYQVEAPGYATKSGNVVLGSESLTENVTLESSQASVHVTCPTTDAQLYINNQLKGTTPWSGSLAAGSYQIEARLQGYRTQKVTEFITERTNRVIVIPALQAITGNLNVNFKPVQSEVWVDGKLLGRTPDVFRNLLVGRHEVEIHKSGYTTRKETVTIAEGQTAMVSGSLETQVATPIQTVTNSTGVEAVETITVKGVSFNMVRVEDGTFKMGSNDSETDSDEKPVHQVTLSTFSIGETEVTQELWQTVMGSNPSYFKGADLPVEQVSWEDCQEFISRLNSLTGRQFRLPTEAEWEFAARDGTKNRRYKYSGSNIIGDVAWYDGNSGNKTHPVKTKQANKLGLYDMSGNVWEWCQDRYGGYNSRFLTNPTGPESGPNRVYRGGCWDSDARDCRSAYRGCYTPSHRDNNLGLRLAF